MSISSDSSRTNLRPKVTGLSPKEGVPGTKIIIRGENFGRNADDLIELTICGVNCLMYVEWINNSKILTRSGKCDGLGDVIITTISGGTGTCTVQFRGLPDIVSPTKDCSVWINEEDYFSLGKANHGLGSTTSPGLYASDPLGLLPEGTEAVKSALGENVIRQFFPEALSQDKSEKGFGNAFSHDFIPVWYLLENHSTASFDDLVTGLDRLKARVNQRTPSTSSLGPLQLLKPNVLAIIECLDALKTVHINLKKHKQEMGSDLTYKVEELIKKSLSEAHIIFDSVLARKDLADSTRNALNVLQRYRFLFNLPATIERNITNGEYELLISDYNRAKAHFADTQVSVFKRVFSEVEQRIIKFREKLQDLLNKGCLNHENRNIDEIKKLIQYLLSLEAPGNPAWDSIVKIKETLLSEMKECHCKYVEMSKLPQIISKDSPNFLSDGDSDVQGPPIIQFIEELTTIFTTSFADLVKLGTAYLDGDFNTKESQRELELKETNFNTEMVQKPILLAVNLIRSALLPGSIISLGPDYETWPASAADESFFVWLPRCLRVCSNFYRDLTRNDLQPVVYQPIQQLITDLRVHSLVSLFNQAAEEVKQLSTKENWEIVSDDSSGTRTQLPLLFEAKVIEILQLVRENILQTTTHEEVDIFSKINVQGRMKQLAQNLLQAFLLALEKTYKNPVSPPSPSDKERTIDEEDRCLVVICNCSFTTNQVMPRLHESFEKYNYPDMTMVIKVIQNKYRDLENKLSSSFVDNKCDLVINGLKPSMYTVANEWYTGTSKPSEVNYYIKEVIGLIIEVQAKIFLVAPSLVRKMVSQIIEATLEEIATLFQSVSDRLTDAGNIHAQVDLTALEYVFSDPEHFETPKTDKLLKMARSRLRPVSSSSDQKLILKILNRFKSSMQLQLLCFKWASDSTVIIV
ncbi:exocyst complex component 2-like [Tetranychus urticae]|uniref:Exocyst complex component 2 n=1 Tax=Tetranychus urticae TaxID=32264 RepID=T1K5J8_TETUR|nr:exocyst complex component 2-like [Tetranychus urticae]